MLKEYTNYTFFWNGPFSQWYPSPFEANGIKFNCAEQYMMYQKAVLFDDMETAKAILATKSPKEQKQLGRQVKNFDADTWNLVARDIVYAGNVEKFTQNPELMMVLLNTQDTLLVEASPYDKIWGIGLNEAEARDLPKSKWRGTNWLGEVLTKVRENAITETK